jgi:hypothetical protein
LLLLALPSVSCCYYVSLPHDGSDEVDSLQITLLFKASNLSSNVILKDKALKKVHSKHHSKLVFVFRKNKVLITLNPKDQNNLRQTGGMTDRQYIAFDNMLKDITGFSVLDQKIRLRKWWKGLCTTLLYIIWLWLSASNRSIDKHSLSIGLMMWYCNALSCFTRKDCFLTLPF